MSDPEVIHLRRNHDDKFAAKATAGIVSLEISALQAINGTSSIKTVSALAAGTAVGATGIGLLIGAGALTLGGGAIAAKSAYKTNKHINNLKKIKSVVPTRTL